jgi:SAM-dependent methyltransferase
MLDPEAIRPSIVLAAYAEPLLDGRRVVVFGDSSSELARELTERGARLVHVYDPDPARVTESATRNTLANVSIALLSESGFAVRDGAFDFGLVEDLTQAGPAHSVLKRLRRVLSPRGVALVAAPNPEIRARLLPSGPVIDSELDYYQLYDAVSAEFSHVRMLGQTPFVGYAVVDFALAGTPEPSLDTAFVPGGAEEPEWFLALASAMPIRLDEYQVVQIPMRAVRVALRGGAADAELARAQNAERRARERMAALEAEVGELGQKLRSQRVRDPSAEVVARLEQELTRRDKWIAELEARAAVADARADEAEEELEALRQEPAQPAPDPGLDAELEGLRDQTKSLEARLAEQTERVAALTRAADAPPEADDVSRLEAVLRERGAELRRAERRVTETERVGRELLDELERLAELNAEREADLQVARWSLEKLEGGAAPRELELAQAELQRAAVLASQVTRQGGQ